MAIVIGDNDFYQLQYTGAEVDAYLASSALFERTKAFIPYFGAAASYTVFFRFNSSGTSSTHCQVFVAGVGRAAGTDVGAYILDVRVASGSLSAVKATVISAPSTTCTFGYYTEGDYTYIGVYRSSNYSNPMTAELLGFDPSTAIGFEVGTFYQNTSQPTGWTTIS